MSQRNYILDEALRLQSLGISVIPIGAEKRPAIKWKKFQTKAADARQIHDWFYGRDDLGVGMILGPVSGNLVARDYDKLDSFRRWAKSNQKLADTLPIAKASRAPHAYARIPNCPSKTFGDGELRANGLYIVAPPSVHPTGHTYTWVRQFNKLDDVPLLTLEESGFGRDWQLSSPPRPKQRKLEVVTTDRTEIDSVRSVLSVLDVEELIAGTIPLVFGTRRKSLFQLARRIRIHSKLGDTPLPKLKPILRLWHQRALSTITTKGFDETWTDFVESFGNVDLIRCADSVLGAMNEADARELPKVAMNYDGVNTRRLIALCAELSRRSCDGVFYLSCRKAADTLGESDFGQVARTLKMLCADDVLVVTEPGGPQTNRASRYRFLGDSNRVAG